MDWTIYWFMFPVAICVASVAMLSGIGGAALFTPLLLIVFPLLGPEYPLATPAAAVGAALLTTAFGFGSGFVGYYRRRLIDFAAALPFIAVAAPAAVAGALLAHAVAQAWIEAVYAAPVLTLAVVLVRERPAGGGNDGGSGGGKDGAGRPDDANGGRPLRTIAARDGTLWRYPAPR